MPSSSNRTIIIICAFFIILVMWVFFLHNHQNPQSLSSKRNKKCISSIEPNIQLPWWSRCHVDSSLHMSQNGESAYAFDRFFKGMNSSGTFLEMGALDGITYSNSYFFEYELGWRGVLIEPNMNSFPKLKQNRKNSICVNAAVCQSEQEVHFVDKVNPAVSGIWEFADPKFRKDWGYPPTTEGIPTVKCAPLHKILEKIDFHHVDFFSLDVEGGEEKVLESIDWEKFSFCVMVVEADGNNLKKDRAVRSILQKNGYVFYSRVKSNEWYTNPRCKF